MTIYLYQIWYDENSKPANDSGFLPFDCRNNPEFLKREIAHLMRFYDEIVANGNNDDYFALLSPRFFEKTGLTSQNIITFINENPSQDVYLFNPYPMNVYYYLNVWEQGEEHHQNLKKLTQNLLNQANIDFNIFSNHRNTIDNTVYCNYWVGSKSFFDKFIMFIRHLDNAIEQMPNDEKELYFQETTYFRTTAIFYPFIFERVICLFLLLNPNIQTKPYIYSKDNKIINKTKRLYRKFYLDGYREQYDNYERQEKNTEILTEKFKLLNQYINPNISIFPFRFLNRWANSILKKINMFKLKQILDTIQGK